MNDDFTDYADLISQYEATEYDMLDALTKSDSGDAQGQFERRRNAPVDSDSDSESDGLDDNASQTSYELDNTEVDGRGEDLKIQAQKSDDNDSETSYELDNTEGDDGGEDLEIDSKTIHNKRSNSDDEDSDSYDSEESSEYHSFASADGSGGSDNDSLSASDNNSDSGNHSTRSDRSMSSDEESNDGSNSSHSEDINDKVKARYDSGVSISYETDDSFSEFDVADPRTRDTTTPLDSTDIENLRDKSAKSRSTNSDDNDDDDDFSDANDSEDDNEPHELTDHSQFNRRGMSNHSFQHPSVNSGTLSDSSDGWESEDSSSQGSQPVPFEDEPKNESKRAPTKSPKPSPNESPKRRGSNLSDSDILESDDDSNDEKSEEEFEDEPQSNQTKTKNRQRNHSGSDGSNNDSESESSDGSEYIIDDSEYSDEYSDDDNDNDKGRTNDEFRDETTQSDSKRRGKPGRQTSLSTLVSSVDLEHIVNREKIVVDREDTVNTRERKFTRWFIIISVLVCLGAIILLIVYFVKPKGTDDSSPKSAPTVAPVVVPGPIDTVPTIQPSALPGQSPVIDTTAKPTPMPQNEVVVETSFMATVLNGKANGITAKDLEGDLKDTFSILFPLLLSEVLQSDALATPTRKHLRTLQYTGDESIAILNPIGVDVIEVDCPIGEPASTLCVEITTNVSIFISSNIFTREYASQLESAYSSAITNAIDDGGLEVDPNVIIFPYDDRIGSKDGEPTEAPIESGDGETQSPTLRGTVVPTSPPKKLTFPPTIEPTEYVSSSSSMTDTSNSAIPDSDIASSPIPSPTDAPNDTSTLNPSAATSSASSPTDTPKETITSNPSAPNPTASPNMETFPTVSPDNVFCKDKNDECFDVLESGECSLTKCAAWKADDECNKNPQYMNLKCRNTCDRCGDSDNVQDPNLTEIPTESPTEGPCSDLNTMCTEWAMQNECSNNQEFMGVNCRDACGFCACEDKNDGCSDISLETGECLVTKCDLWASDSQCDTNRSYMDIYCRKSCDRCGDSLANSCKDDDDRCSFWATEGECAANPSYMEQKCAQSCGLC